MSLVFDQVGGLSYFKKGLGKDEFMAKVKEKLIDGIFKPELEEFVRSVLKDSWAFWLDSVQARIKEATTSHIQSVLIEELRTHFEPLVSRSKSFDGNVTQLLSLTQFPEQQASLGHLFLRHGNKAWAKVCYERAAANNEPSGSALTHLAYCEIPCEDVGPEQDRPVRKRVRRRLKAAKAKLNGLMNALHTNKMLGEKLAEMTKTAPSIHQFVSPQDNHFCEQVASKTKVLDAHVAIVNKAVGSSLVSDTVFAEGNEDENEKSRQIYFELVSSGVLHHNRVRREFVRDGRLSVEAKRLLGETFDRSISQPVVRLLEANVHANHIEKGLFEAAVRDNEYFWALIERSAVRVEKVQVLDMERATKDLSEQHREAFDQLMGKLAVRLVSV